MRSNFFILFIGLLIMGFSVQAQKNKSVPVKEVNVPENVNSTFKSLYGAASNNHWNKNYSGNFVASFTNADQLKQTAEFSASGAMVKSKVEYLPENVPENVRVPVLAQFPTARFTEAAKLQLPGVAPYYRVKIINADNTTKELLISEEGTISE
jgi:hypothetical protein